MTTIEVWTDGSSAYLHEIQKSVGGWAALIAYTPFTKQRLIGNGLMQANSQQAELWACIHALEYFKRPAELTLHIDSRYVYERVIKQKVVETNAELFERLLTAATRHRITWNWVSSHSGCHGNEVVNERAGREMRRVAKRVRKQIGRATWQPKW